MSNTKIEKNAESESLQQSLSSHSFDWTWLCCKSQVHGIRVVGVIVNETPKYLTVLIGTHIYSKGEYHPTCGFGLCMYSGAATVDRAVVKAVI